MLNIKLKPPIWYPRTEAARRKKKLGEGGVKQLRNNINIFLERLEKLPDLIGNNKKNV